MTQIILIFEDSKLKSFLTEYSDKDNLIIAGTEEIKNHILNLNQQCKSINDYSDSFLNAKKSLNWIKNWPDKPILNGKSFKELLIYENISIYWFLETRFYSYRIQTLIHLVEQINNILNTKHDSIVIKGNSDAFHIISEKLKTKSTQIKFIDNTMTKSSVSKNSYSGNTYLKLWILKFFRGIFPISKNQTNEKPVLFVTELSSWRKEYDYSAKKFVERDAYFFSLMKKLSDSSIPMRIIDFENRTSNLFKSFIINKKRQKIINSTVEPWEKYVNQKIISKTKNFNKKLNNLLNTLFVSDEFKNSLTYDGISLYKILKKDFIELLSSLKTYVSPTMIEASKRILDEIKPSVIVMHDEYGTLQLCIIKQAIKRKIPTISIQHGANTKTWLSYTHNLEHIQGQNSDLNFPLPDRLCVWSENAKSNLIKYGNFPPTVPVITGDPKSDFLFNTVKNFNAKNILSTFKFPSNKKIILFATQPLSNITEKNLLTNSVFHAISKLENSFLIVKIHPNELDLNYYTKIATNHNVKNYTLKKFENLYELMFVSNVVVVPYSTVGFEAMRLRKPVIAMNMLGLHDDDPLIDNNVVAVARNNTELITSIKKYLDVDQIGEILDKQEHLAEKEIGTIDGNAYLRIFNLVLELSGTKSRLHLSI